MCVWVACALTKVVSEDSAPLHWRPWIGMAGRHAQAGGCGGALTMSASLSGRPRNPAAGISGPVRVHMNAGVQGLAGGCESQSDGTRLAAGTSCIATWPRLTPLPQQGPFLLPTKGPPLPPSPLTAHALHPTHLWQGVSALPPMGGAPAWSRFAAAALDGSAGPSGERQGLCSRRCSRRAGAARVA